MRIVRLSSVLIFVILLSAVLVLYSCKPVETNVFKHSILVVVAHPDDETLISGTLAKLCAQGCQITIVFVSSGDDGPDRTGNGLHGAALADVREAEVVISFDPDGVINSPDQIKQSSSYPVWLWESAVLEALCE